MIDLLLSTVNILAESSEGGGELLILLAGPIAGSAFYLFFYKKYRNADKTHTFEHETDVKVGEIAGRDNKVGHIAKTTETEISNNNIDKYRKRVKRINVKR